MIRLSIFLGILHYTTSLAIAQERIFQAHEFPEIRGETTSSIICQDDKGLLWIGTPSGVFRYDGHEYVPIRTRFDSGTEEVSALYPAKDGQIWVGFTDGRYCKLKNKSLRECLTTSGQRESTAVVTGFAEDSVGRLWISTYGDGLLLYDGKEWSKVGVREGLPGADIYCMVAGPDGTIYLGTDNGVAAVQVSNGQVQVQIYTTEDGLPDVIIKSLAIDDHGRIWVGTHDGGISSFLPATGSWEQPDQRWEWGEITAIEVFGNDVWVGTAQSGIIRFSPATGTYKSMQLTDNRADRKIYDLFIDDEGLLWVLTNGPHLYSTNLQVQVSAALGEGNIIQSVLCTRNATYWIGSNNGLYRYLSEENASKLHFPGLHVISLYEDAEGRIWVGTFGNGVLCFDPVTGKKKWLDESLGLFNGSVLAIDGRDNKVWLATLGGVTEWTTSDNLLESGPVETKNYLGEDGLGSGYVYCVYADSRGDVWFGTDGDGVSVLSNGKLENIPEIVIERPEGATDTVQLKTVYSITEDGLGNVWFSTSEDEVFWTDGNAFKQATVRNARGITGLQGIDQEHLLMVHKSGIELLHPVTGQVAYLTSRNTAEELNPQLNASSPCPDGCVVIGGQSRLNWYCPIQGVKTSPGIHIFEVLDVSEPLAPEALNSLTYIQNDIVIQYTGLWFTDPESVIYRYRLKGHQREWIETKDQQVVFANLPPGSYTFEVAAGVDHFSGQEPLAAVDFRILRPFWMKWWFWASLALFVTTLVYRLLKVREQRLLRLNKLEKEKAESRFELLKSQINPHFLFNSFNTLIAIIEDNPALAVNFTEHMADFYRRILVHRNQSLIPLQEELELVRIYGFLLSQRFGNNFSIEITGVAPTDCSVPPLTLQMLVENAVKHNTISSGKPLTIQIDIDKKSMTAVVSNPIQKKISPPKSTGFGLQNIKSQYALLADTEVLVDETQGQFRVTIPLIKSHTNDRSDY